jgi:hypothetical protein
MQNQKKTLIGFLFFSFNVKQNLLDIKAGNRLLLQW